MTTENLLPPDHPIDISILLPTRGRPKPLEQCLRTLLDRAKDPSRIEVMLAFDNDDTENIKHFVDVVQPYLDDLGVEYSAIQFERLGYMRLNEYLNELAKHSQGSWLFFWNDDAVMKTQDWDQVIRDNGQEFNLLRAETNHEHPYAIFPILPKKWVEITGHLSPHQINDAWTSQVAWMLDIVKTIPVMVHHERYDLTGENLDETFKERIMLENMPGNDPRDFNHITWRKRRIEETEKIADYLDSIGRDTTWFRESMTGKNPNIWSRMVLQDPHKRLRQWKDSPFE
jgi:hypothetical protein